MAENVPAGHEIARHHAENRVQIRPVLIFGGVLVVMSIGVLLVARGLIQTWTVPAVPSDVPPALLAEAQPPPPALRLQVKPSQELQQVREKENTLLEHYGWVNREAGVVRIPLQDAMALLIKRGLPARQEKQP